MEEIMSVKRFALSTIFIVLILGLTHTAGVAVPPDGIIKCTVINDTEYKAHITLIMAPNNSTYNVTIPKHHSFSIPNDYYCPKCLTGKLTYGILSGDIVPMCTGNNVEGSPGSCPEDCTNSTWKIQITGKEAHFIRQ